MALAPSRLSPQTELLKDDLDLESLILFVGGRPSIDLLPRITAAPAERTISGASTLTFELTDRDRAISKSGFNAAKVDVEVDGLWFRLKAFDRRGDTLTLTFEDREVAVLRDFPGPDAPHHGFKVWDARQVSRVAVAQFLVAEAAPVLRIPFFSPGAAKTPLQTANDVLTAAARNQQRGFGFSPAAKITVKGAAATAEQKRNIDHVLLAGEAKLVARKLLVCAVMVITQESSARTSATNGVHVGLFQQDPRYWPATRDPVTDANAWYDKAIAINHAHPSLQDWQLCEDVQQSGRGELYEQWQAEAERTVTAWGVEAGGSGTQTPTKLPPSTDSSFQFTRGTRTTQNGKSTFVREDNWACLQRLAAEVNWRCFCVSGAVYFTTDADLLASQPQMTLTEETEGVDSIDGSSDEGRRSIRKGHRVQQLHQQVTIPCRIGRWAAPPGTAVELDDTGLFDGRWLVDTIARDLFLPDGTITLTRPQTALPEAKAPEYLATGPTILQSAGGAESSSAFRSEIVAAAKRAAELRADFRYEQVRPMPNSLFGGNPPHRIDCSAFFTLCYKQAGAPDPNGFGYNGQGNTRSLAATGAWTLTPQPGDAVFYGDTRTFPHHVAVYIGDGRIVNMGGAGDPREMAVTDVPLVLLGYMTFRVPNISVTDPVGAGHQGTR